MRALATALGCALAACAPRVPDGAPARTETIAIGETTVRLEYQARDASSARRVVEALVRAIPSAERWGQLRVPVTVVLHPSHAALEEAVHRDGFSWLRAWARFDTIDLQSPRTWNLIFPPAPAEIEELLAHELTHCVMYQRAGSAWSWPYKGIPLWFREGMASVTAGQGHKRSGPESLWAFYANATPGAGGGAPSAGGDGGRPGRLRRDGDPISDPEPLYQGEADLVYGAAHHAFQFLLDRYGAERVQRLLAEMGDGHGFEAAFRSAIGIPAEAFEAEFRRYVTWRGWDVGFAPSPRAAGRG